MDATAGGAAFLGGTEIVNAERTCTYLKNGVKPSGMNVFGDCCSCSNTQDLIDCDNDDNLNGPYTIPSDPLSPAPWYDAAIPESADFAGFLPIEFNGLGSTAVRSVTNSISGGAILGRLRFGPREMTWRGYLIGRSCCSVAYGLRWLTAQLTQVPCDSCQGEDLDILVCCPETVGTIGCCPDEGTCGHDPTIVLPAPVVPTEAFRLLKNVGILNGPNILSERRTSCGCGCNVMTEVEFTLVAGKPWLYKNLVPLSADCQEFVDAAGTCPDITKLLDGEDCPADTTTCVLSVDCNINPECPEPTLPTVPTLTDDCVCDAIAPGCAIFSIPKSDFGSAFEAVPVIKIYSGNQPMRGVKLRFYENPQERDCSEIVTDKCVACDELDIQYIPAFSTLIIDGTTNRITLDCPGQGDDLSAENLTHSPFSWPVLRCINYCLCIEVDLITIAAGNADTTLNACASVQIAPREA